MPNLVEYFSLQVLYKIIEDYLNIGSISFTEYGKNRPEQPGDTQATLNQGYICNGRPIGKANSLSQSVCRTMELNMFVDWGNYWPS